MKTLRRGDGGSQTLDLMMQVKERNSKQRHFYDYLPSAYHLPL